MDRSRFLAAVIGPTLAVTGLSLFLNRALLPGMIDAVAQDPAVILLVGVATLPVGLAIVLAHNVWRGWPVVVTVVGWLAVVGGAARILFPVQLAAFAPTVARCPPVPPVVGGVFLLAGLFLSLMAFRPPRAA